MSSFDSLRVQTYHCPSLGRFTGASAVAAVALQAKGTTVVLGLDGNASVFDQNSRVALGGPRLLDSIPMGCPAVGSYAYGPFELYLEEDHSSRKESWSWRIVHESGTELRTYRRTHARVRGGTVWNSWLRVPGEIASDADGLCKGKCVATASNSWSVTPQPSDHVSGVRAGAIDPTHPSRAATTLLACQWGRRGLRCSSRQK